MLLKQGLKIKFGIDGAECSRPLREVGADAVAANHRNGRDTTCRRPRPVLLGGTGGAGTV